MNFYCGTYNKTKGRTEENEGRRRRRREEGGGRQLSLLRQLPEEGARAIVSDKKRGEVSGGRGAGETDANGR